MPKLFTPDGRLALLDMQIECKTVDDYATCIQELLDTDDVHDVRRYTPIDYGACLKCGYVGDFAYHNCDERQLTKKANKEIEENE